MPSRLAVSACLVVTVLLGSAAPVRAACDVTTASTSGVSVTLNGIGSSYTVHLCVTSRVIQWGLYGSPSGANPFIDTLNNLPMTAGGLTLTSLSYSSAKASYTFVPIGDLSATTEYDITVNSVTGVGSDTITLWYASSCTIDNACNSNPTPTNTAFTMSVTLPVAPTVTSVAPAVGPTGGGTSVAITGTGFTGATSVKFGDSQSATFTIDSSTSIVATTQPGSGTVHVTVTRNGLTSASSSADQYTFAPPPTVTLVSPSAGSTAGGTAVTLTGTGFLAGATVTFGGTSATSVSVVNSTTITAATPAHAAGAVTVGVMQASGTAQVTSGFTYVVPPTASGISPGWGPTTGGTGVTIAGTAFVNGTTVTIGGTAATSVVVASGTSLSAVAPAHVPGRADVVVTVPGNVSATMTGGFVYVSRGMPTADFDGDHRPDVSVFRPSTGTWFSMDSSSGNATYRNRGWGVQAQGDTPFVGDFDGDGLVDPTVYRPSTGTWFVLGSGGGFATWTSFGWGVSTDTPMPADYDGDGRTDAAVYRPSTGVWYIRPSNGATQWNAAFGTTDDIPLAGDFDGDGKADLAVYRPSTGTWFWLESSTNFTAYDYRGWGSQAQGDIPAPGDYDGDGKTDLCVFRPSSGTWFILESHAGYTTWTWQGWGATGDILVPSDYDGDGKTDVAVYRASSGTWYVKPASGAATWSVVFGQAADVPLLKIR
jgi:hypothetical protein